jgi:hypothetical protein
MSMEGSPEGNSQGSTMPFVKAILLGHSKGAERWVWANYFIRDLGDL